MHDLLNRGWAADIDVRSDGRTVSGIAVPFDEPTRVTDMSGPPYLEQFTRGAFARTIAERGARVKFLLMHDRHQLPIVQGIASARGGQRSVRRAEGQQDHGRRRGARAAA
jgi:phage head maturation protease